MNIYDKKQIKCSACNKFIGEINHKAKVSYPLCSKCIKKENKFSKTGIQKILVPIDDSLKSTKALDTSIFMAKHFGAKVTVLHIKPVMPYGGFRTLVQLQNEVSQKSKKIINSAKNYCSKKGLAVTGKIVKGDEVHFILKTAISGKFDLIIMGSSGKGPLKEAILGSISNNVLQNSKIPILMVKESSKKLKI